MDIQEESGASESREIEIIRALATGEISTRDARKLLDDDAIDALDLVMALVSQAKRAAVFPVGDRIAAHIQNFSRVTPPDIQKAIVHKVPFVPVMLNGILYDPADIRRFDGVELHFVPAEDCLIAIDDRSVIARWWEASYLSSLLEPRTSGSGAPELREFPTFPPLDPSVPGGGTPYSPDGGIPETQFFEHANYQGDVLYLRRDRGYANLLRVGRGFLGLGDWNDVISSVRLGNVRIAVLYEHIHYGGSTISARYQGQLANLAALGWNDRASSVGTW